MNRHNRTNMRYRHDHSPLSQPPTHIEYEVPRTKLKLPETEHHGQIPKNMIKICTLFQQLIFYEKNSLLDSHTTRQFQKT
uniref:Uncharacterized protein n=1 Tax=Populus trichocarpa TaxID=3694 RepID=A0A2K1WN72_POPTR